MLCVQGEPVCSKEESIHVTCHHNRLAIDALLPAAAIQHIIINAYSLACRQVGILDADFSSVFKLLTYTYAIIDII
jgi:hypothetical protein